MGTILAGCMIFAEGVAVGYTLHKTGVLSVAYDKIKGKLSKKPQESLL